MGVKGLSAQALIITLLQISTHLLDHNVKQGSLWSKWLSLPIPLINNVKQGSL